LSAQRSKKPSAKPASSAPRSDVVLFVDRSLGRRSVAEALRAAGFAVIAHDEQFPQKTPDETWLATAGAAGWLVLSADRAIRRKPNELAAFTIHRVRAVFLTSGNMRGNEQAALFVRLGRKIQDTAMSTKAPAAFSLRKDGTLEPLSLRPRSPRPYHRKSRP